jgi:hypothetical protein
MECPKWHESKLEFLCIFRRIRGWRERRRDDDGDDY